MRIIAILDQSWSRATIVQGHSGPFVMHRDNKIKAFQTIYIVHCNLAFINSQIQYCLQGNQSPKNKLSIFINYLDCFIVFWALAGYYTTVLSSKFMSSSRFQFHRYITSPIAEYLSTPGCPASFFCIQGPITNDIISVYKFGVQLNHLQVYSQTSTRHT